MGEVANALQLKPAEGMFGGAQKPAEAPAEKAKPPQPAAKAKAPRKTAKAADQAATGVVDPLQWWSALTQQFQQIATDAMKDAAAHAAADPGRNLGGAAAANEPTATAATAKGATGASSGKAAKSAAARAKRPARKTEES